MLRYLLQFVKLLHICIKTLHKAVLLPNSVYFLNILTGLSLWNIYLYMLKFVYYLPYMLKFVYYLLYFWLNTITVSWNIYIFNRIKHTVNLNFSFRLRLTLCLIRRSNKRTCMVIILNHTGIHYTIMVIYKCGFVIIIVNLYLINNWSTLNTWVFMYLSK